MPSGQRFLFFGDGGSSRQTRGHVCHNADVGRDASLVEYLACAGRRDANRKVRDDDRSRSRCAFCKINCSDGRNAVGCNRPAARSAGDAFANITNIVRFARGLRASFARIGDVKRDEQIGQRRRGRIICKVGDCRAIEDQLEQVVFE